MLTATIPIGTILQARTPIAGDPYSVVRVVGAHFVREVEEVVLAPALTFGSPVSAPVSGDGGVLQNFDVLSASEAAAIEGCE